MNRTRFVISSESPRNASVHKIRAKKKNQILILQKTNPRTKEVKKETSNSRFKSIEEKGFEIQIKSRKRKTSIFIISQETFFPQIKSRKKIKNRGIPNNLTTALKIITLKFSSSTRGHRFQFLNLHSGSLQILKKDPVFSPPKKKGQ